ncbi:MAG: protein translocase subunit SecF [Gammaproteobacteria bacterium]|nr:protein translocase subunit SecF [Gammaproteobacteria bacterium]MDH5630758.1 protein translocase subunit SecF [Gammaproteobacteria bacterium]
MGLFKSKFNIDFFKYRLVATIFSGCLILASIFMIATKGINWGLDFTGGTLVQVSYSEEANINEIRDLLASSGYEKVVVQNFGTSRDIIIRLAPDKNPDAGKEADKIGNEILVLLQESSSTKVELQRTEFVGSSVGDELTQQGGLAILVALIFILIYVSLRFEWKFALGSVAALAHDVLITIGFFALIQMEFDLTVLAAVLAVIGYSLNDTIVVFDRIRENFLRLRKQEPVEVINLSINQTLARTIMTSFTTLEVLIALFILGGASIHGFATALLTGVIVGTYSSIYVASNVTLALGVSKEDLMPPEIEKEGADQEAFI